VRLVVIQQMAEAEAVVGVLLVVDQLLVALLAHLAAKPLTSMVTQLPGQVVTQQEFMGA
jgi:hypothetical protein